MLTRSISPIRIGEPVLMMDIKALKSPKRNTADGLIERTSSMLDEEIESKTVHNDKEGEQ